MATTRSQAARDAAPETTTERESVASETRTDKLMALLQQIVANQIKEKRARENYQEKRQERERERQWCESRGGHTKWKTDLRTVVFVRYLPHSRTGVNLKFRNTCMEIVNLAVSVSRYLCELEGFV